MIDTIVLSVMLTLNRFHYWSGALMNDFERINAGWVGISWVRQVHAESHQYNEVKQHSSTLLYRIHC